MQVTPADWERIKSLFEEAIRLEPRERSSFLKKECPDDELRILVDRLVLSHSQAGDFLTTPSWTPVLFFPRYAFAAGDLLAERFEITRLIAQGGMGEVYEAIDIELKNKVAIKTI